MRLKAAFLLLGPTTLAFRPLSTQRPASRLLVTVPERSVTEDATLPAQEAGEVYCNREINLRNLDAIGFDMDFTLAQYEVAFDLLAFEGAKEKLVEELGYPAEVMDFVYDAGMFTRGLIIDKARGNILKIDRHKYVRVASHGTQLLSSAARKDIYRPGFEGGLEFKGASFVKMDTLFHVVDASLFAQLVDLKDRLGAAMPQAYPTMYRDVRACVDLCHRDGTIKEEVARNPVPYIKRDPNLLPMLRGFKAAGIKVFLLTNSYWEYTNVVMNFLWGNEPGSKDLEWTSLFDVVITGSNKPHFLTDPYLSLFRVQCSDGTLVNTDGAGDDAEGFLAQGRVFQGGNFRDLHKMLRLSSGERLLYVGDHMFADVLRTKRSLGWRTCLVIPELEHELKVLGGAREAAGVVRGLRAKLLAVDRKFDDVVSRVGLHATDKLASELAACDAEQAGIKAQLKAASMAYHELFHPTWGQLFKAGYQSSQFAKQVEGYACLYATRASDLVACPLRHFRPDMDESPHERGL